MNIIEKLRSMMDLPRSQEYVVFVLSHEDADALLASSGRVPDLSAAHWRFQNIPVVAAHVRTSYVVSGWEEPRIDML
jgi:hypothetical protein